MHSRFSRDITQSITFLARAPSGTQTVSPRSKLTQHDVIIVGGGAAGLNAALILGRARRNALVVDDGRPRNAVAPKMHGYLSRDGTPPLTLLAIARRELKSYPTLRFIKGRVKRSKRVRDGFAVTLESGARFSGKRLLLANGVCDKLPPIRNLAKYWGKSVFVCPFCDGWEIQDRKVTVYGKTRDAIGLAQELRGWTKHVTVCTESSYEKPSPKQARWLRASGCQFIEGAVTRLIGKTNGKLTALAFKKRATVPCDALFLCSPLRQSCAIAKDLGCKRESSGAVVVDEGCRTNVAGCFAAGDAVTNMHQVILAAASGVRAAISITTELLCDEADAMAGQRSQPK
jgi:thioredoxin reductase